VAVGETWTPDAGAIGKAFAARLPLVLDKVTTETRLEGVAEGAATVLVSLKLPLRGLQTGESSPLLAWKKGGTVEVSMRMTRTAGSAFEGTLVRESVLEGIADAQGADVDFDMVSRAEIVVRAGGTMPPIPGRGADPCSKRPVSLWVSKTRPAQVRGAHQSHARGEASPMAKTYAWSAPRRAGRWTQADADARGLLGRGRTGPRGGPS
jgi:hypothetical protein